MEKYGFVYIWFDRKNKRYYIGCHWGTEDDGYICSSTWMRNSFNRRPQDFKRRIISRVYSNYNDLLEEEYRWLSFINPKEISPNTKVPRYYNLSLSKNGHWANSEEGRLKTLSERISKCTKAAMNRLDVRDKYLKGLENRNNIPTEETLEKRRQSMIKTMAEKFPVEQRADYNRPKFNSKEYKENMSKSVAKKWERLNKEQRQEIGSKISQSLMGKQNRLGQTNSEEHCRKISEGLKGKIHPRYRICIDGIEYISTQKASDVLNISVATINRRLKSNKYKEYYRLGL